MTFCRPGRAGALVRSCHTRYGTYFHFKSFLHPLGCQHHGAGAPVCLTFCSEDARCLGDAQHTSADCSDVLGHRILQVSPWRTSRVRGSHKSRSPLQSALTSSGCHNKVPWTCWHKAPGMYSLTVLEARTIRSRGRWGCSASQGGRRGSFSPPPASGGPSKLGVPCLAAASLQSLPSSSQGPCISASFSFLSDLGPVVRSVTNYICKDPVSKPTF